MTAGTDEAMQSILPIFFALSAFLCGHARAAEKPNILLAFADDWGRHASAYAQLGGPGTVNWRRFLKLP